MGLNFRRSIKIAPGVRLNFGKKSMSVSVGGKGARITHGTKGTTVSSGIPGTGIYYRRRVGSSKSSRQSMYGSPQEPGPFRSKKANRVWGWIFLILSIIFLSFSIFSDMENINKILGGAMGLFLFLCSVAYFTGKSTDDNLSYEESNPDAFIKDPFAFAFGLIIFGVTSYLLIKSFSWNDMNFWGWFFYPIVLFFWVFAIMGLYIGIKGESADDFKPNSNAFIKIPFVFLMGLLFFGISGYLLYASFSWKYMGFWGYFFYPVDILLLFFGGLCIIGGLFGEIENNSSEELSEKYKETDQSSHSNQSYQYSHLSSDPDHESSKASPEQEENADLIETNTNDSFPDVLKFIVNTKGIDYFLKKEFFNSIKKSQSLKKIPLSYYFLMQLFYSGSLKRLISTTNFQLESQKLCNQFAKSCGVKESVVLYIVQSIGYAMGHVNERPQYNDLSSSYLANNSQSQPLAKQSTSVSKKTQAPKDYREPYIHYKNPSTSLLKETIDSEITINIEANHSITKRVESILDQEFGIHVTDVKITNSNFVDYIECSTQPGSRLGRLINNEDILSGALSSRGIRLLAPIPGTDKIGIELPANNPHSLYLKEIFDSAIFQTSEYELPCFIGRTPTNEIFGFDLTQLPHLLIAGSSGQGKSSCIHNIIMSMLYKKHPNELKFVLVDYKKIELTPYFDIKDHFLAAPEKDKYDPIVSNDNKAKEMFTKLKEEFDARFMIFAKAGVRNIKDYNTKFCDHRLSTIEGHKYLPYIVIVIDEYTNLIFSNKRWIEPIILDLIKKGRSVGIHFIIGINRPIADIIDSSIKNEITGRIAFKVNTSTDSRLILDTSGAEKLISAGDALFIDSSKILQRVQCAEVKMEDIQRTCEHIMIQMGPTWPYVIENFTITMSSLVDEGKIDPLFEEITRYVILTQNTSASMIQRKFSIGYNRVNRILEQLERAGVVGKAQGLRKREVLIVDENSLLNLLNNLKNV